MCENIYEWWSVELGKPRVLLTGASGSMGKMAFQELLKRKDEFDIVLLLLPRKEIIKEFSKYVGGKKVPVGGRGIVEHEGLKIVYGDLTNPEDVLEAVNGCDFVLHPAALIPPAADRNPELTERVNLGGTKNIINAIKKQPNREGVKLVYISSIAIYGDRLPPVHRIRVGDPLIPSVYDFYATTKLKAEREVIDSGLKYWVSLRQTFIAIPNALSLMDPILFHQPLNTHIELITSQDAGYGLVRCLDAPDDFWCNIYNMGGGESCRFIFKNYIRDMMEIVGIGDYRKIFKRNWFCLRNFHCGWYEDSHILNSYLHHQRQSLEDHYKQVKENIPAYYKLVKIVPKSIIKKRMERMAKSEEGPLNWVYSNNQGRINAFFGSKEKWESIPDWDDEPNNRDEESYLLDHGYDETKTDEDLTIEDLRQAAKFRGGECLSEKLVDTKTKIKWKCAFSHIFEGSPTLILKGGHWCPECTPPPWNYDKIAKKNPFIAQVYYSNHSKDENNYYDY
ncbi:MAG: NAD-dependent epimerase/dehydratase family protein [Candidatus Freyarchaeota archaeon]